MKRILGITLAIILTFGVKGFAADQWDKDMFADDSLISAAPSLMRVNNEALDRVLKNYRKGAKLVYKSATTITVQSGEVVCSNVDGTVRKLRSNTADTDITFTNIDTGAEANDTYYVWARSDTDIEGFTLLISLSSTAPTGATYYKRLGSFYNNASLNIEQVKNDDDNVIIATGSIANAATITVPSGYSQDECDWTVSGYAITGYGENAAGGSNDSYNTYASSSRVVTCTTTNAEAGTTTGTCQYLIICHK